MAWRALLKSNMRRLGEGKFRLNIGKYVLGESCGSLSSRIHLIRHNFCTIQREPISFPALGYNKPSIIVACSWHYILFAMSIGEKLGLLCQYMRRLSWRWGMLSACWLRISSARKLMNGQEPHPMLSTTHMMYSGLVSKIGISYGTLLILLIHD